MSAEAMTYLSNGDWGHAILWIFTDYVGYGIVWILVGAMIFGVTYQKSRSAALSGFIFSFLVAILNVFQLIPVEAQLYFNLLIAVLLFMVLYRVIRG